MKALIRHDITTAAGPRSIEQRVDLDEVVIPGVLHIEDMGDDVWHVALGDGAVTLSVSARGVTVVEIAAHADEALRVLENLGPVTSYAPAKRWQGLTRRRWRCGAAPRARSSAGKPRRERPTRHGARRCCGRRRRGAWRGRA